MLRVHFTEGCNFNGLKSLISKFTKYNFGSHNKVIINMYSFNKIPRWLDSTNNKMDLMLSELTNIYMLNNYMR